LLAFICELLVVMGVSALAAGIVGFLLWRSEIVYLVEPLSSQVPGPKHARFLADFWAHLASDFVGFVGGLVVIVLVWRSRGRRAAGQA
jgi:hypothetical protein